MYAIRSYYVLSDNSYKALPHDAIVYSSTATDETQTNWNGILGYIRLREEDSCFISDIRVYPTLKEADIAVLRITSYNVCYTKLLRRLEHKAHVRTPEY